MELNEIIKLTNKFSDEYFSEFKINIQKVLEEISKDYYFFKECGVDNYDGLYALILYRLSREIVDKSKKEDEVRFFYRIKLHSKGLTTSYISPYTIVECPCGIFGEKIVIDKNFVISSEVKIHNNVQLIAQNEKVGIIGEKAVIGNNVKIYNDAYVGNGVEIEDNCIIRENIKDNSKVKIISELQVKEGNMTDLIVYGIVPKFKNSIIIYGEGFYNPKIKIITPTQTLNNEITYWDKNKIVAKLPFVKIDDNDKNMLVIFSNGQRITIFNAIGVQKTLKNLKK